MLIGGRDGWPDQPASSRGKASTSTSAVAAATGIGHDLQRQLWGINEVFAKYNLAACIKGGLALQGYEVGTPLAPQPALPPEGIEAVRAALTGLGAL